MHDITCNYKNKNEYAFWTLVVTAPASGTRSHSMHSEFCHLASKIILQKLVFEQDGMFAASQNQNRDKRNQ
jgi:hypothetical protein